MLIGVEANIGVGKSTMLPAFVDALNHFNVGDKPWEQIQEPVDDPVFMELLTRFYEEPTTANRVKFQFYVTDRRHDLLTGIDLENKNFVIERSLYSDVIFCHLNFLEMESPEGHYMGYYYYIKKRMETYPKIDHIVYLSCDPCVAHDRIMSRGRGCEKDITQAYIRELEAYHKACLPQQCRVYGAKLHEYDWTNFGDVYQVAMDIKKYESQKA